MAELKTKATKVSAKDFIAAVENDGRRVDAQQLVKLMESWTGWKARMWGPSIIGFGAYHYTYESGHSGTMCAVGFSPRKANLVLYVSHDYPDFEALKDKLGKVKPSKGCLYLGRLSTVDLGVMEKMIRKGVAATKKAWPVTDA